MVAPIRECKVHFEPKQDLHGYDSPWPAGGGKNKFDISSASIKKWQLMSNSFLPRPDSYAYISYTVNADDESVTVVTTGTYMGICFDVSAGSSVRVFSQNETVANSILLYSAYEDGATLVNSSAKSCTIPAETTGVIAALFYAVGTYTIKFQLEEGSTASSWTPYSNICPIIGHTGATVEQRGYNWANIYGYSAAGIIRPTDNRSVTNSYGTTISSVDYEEGTALTIAQANRSETSAVSYKNGYFVIGVHGLVNGARYGFRARINITSNPLNVTSTIILSNGARAAAVNISNGFMYGAFTYNVSGTREYLEVRCSGMSFTISEIMLFLIPANSTDVDLITPYTPYTGTTLPISWQSAAGTVYGGNLTVNSDGTGTLVVDRAMVAFDGTEDYDNTYFPTVVCTKSFNIKGNFSRRNEIISNYGMYPKVNLANSTARTFQWSNADTIYGVSGASELKALFAQYYANGNPMTICYPIATPITHTLTTLEVLKTLKGINNIWGNTGDITLSYWKH